MYVINTSLNTRIRNKWQVVKISSKLKLQMLLGKFEFMRGSRKFCQRVGGGGGGGSNFDFLFSFLVDERRQIIQNTTKSGPPTACHWRVDDGPTLNSGLVAL